MNAGGPDWQTAFDWAMAGLAGLLGWLLKAVHSEIKDARREHADLVQKLPEVYARRDDVKDGFAGIRADLQRIFDKLDDKADA